MIEPSFRKLLSDAQPVRLIVSDRIYLGSDAQDERRARIVVTLASRDNDHTMDGPTNIATGVMAVACLAPTYEAAKTLADAARDALDGYVGLGVSSYIEIDFIQITSEQDVPAAPLEGQSLPTFGVALDCAFMFRDDR